MRTSWKAPTQRCSSYLLENSSGCQVFMLTKLIMINDNDSTGIIIYIQKDNLLYYLVTIRYVQKRILFEK